MSKFESSVIKIYYKFIEDHNLLIQKVTGEWSTKDYIDYINKTLNDKKMIHVKKIFSDLTDVNLENAFKDIDLLIDLREKMINLDYINVNIVNSPTSTVVTHMYQDKIAQNGFPNHHYCSSINTALTLLGLDMSDHEMEDLLKKIKN